MSRYTGTRRSITPSTTNDNWTLCAGSGESLQVLEVTQGGETTTSTAACTRYARSSGQTGATSAGSVEKINPNHATARIAFATTFATTQPTLEAGDLFATSYNLHGGVIRWLAAPGEEWILLGAATELCISSRNTVGTGTSSFHVIWMED